MTSQTLDHACTANLTAWLHQTVPPIHRGLLAIISLVGARLNLFPERFRPQYRSETAR